jgi:hypothetical protein
MWILVIAILAALITAMIATRVSSSRKPGTDTKVEPPAADCCGAHEVCEKDGLMAHPPEKIIYFDDEELDVFRDKDPATYTPEEAEQFREVLITMHPQEVGVWLKSLMARRIKLPPDIREEALNILKKQRA